MNIKSLLLGSAAALLAVSGAHAADAIIAEPEPVEYVRVCDAYGAGFFYIPGTETCLRISGYVWYQIGATSDNGVTDTPNYYGFDPDGWNKTTRARVNFDARSETEWGTLRGFIRFQASWGDPVDGPVAADQAWLSLGGFRAGYTESAWAEGTFDLMFAGSHSWGGLYYGDQQRHLLQYNFGGDTGFQATLSLEDDALDGDGYMPDVVGYLGYAQGWGGVFAKIGYDESYNAANDDGFGAQAGVLFNIPNMEGSSFKVVGFYSDADHSYGPFSALGVQPEWSVLASYYHQFTPTFGASVGAQYFSDLYAPGTDISTGVDAFAAELSLVWTPVENFEVRAEGVYDKVEELDGTMSGFLRFTRFF